MDIIGGQLPASVQRQRTDTKQASYEHFVAAWQPRPKASRDAACKTLPDEENGCAAASPRQGFDGPPDDASSRRAALRHEVDRTTEG